MKIACWTERPALVFWCQAVQLILNDWRSWPFRVQNAQLGATSMTWCKDAHLTLRISLLKLLLFIFFWSCSKRVMSSTKNQQSKWVGFLGCYSIWCEPAWVPSTSRIRLWGNPAPQIVAVNEQSGHLVQLSFSTDLLAAAKPDHQLITLKCPLGLYYELNHVVYV